MVLSGIIGISWKLGARRTWKWFQCIYKASLCTQDNLHHLQWPMMAGETHRDADVELQKAKDIAMNTHNGKKSICRILLENRNGSCLWFVQQFSCSNLHRQRDENILFESSGWQHCLVFINSLRIACVVRPTRASSSNIRPEVVWHSSGHVPDIWK